MTKVIFLFLVDSFLFLSATSQPLKNDISQEKLAGHVESTAIAIFFVVSCIISVGYCVCCSAKNVKDLGQQNGISAPHRSSNNFPSNVNNSEFTIFPPSSIITQPSNYSDDKVTFEPLPEILPQKSCDDHPGDQLQLAKINNCFHKGLGDWFNESLCDYFPRNKLQYHQELGSCWFGQVVLGEAKGIIENEPATKVVVKILKQDATPNEYVNFLQEIRPFRDLNHPNVIKLLGYCLETNPYLFIMEHCAMDLKAYLISHCDEAEFLLQSGHVLRIACDIAAGLQHMHDQDFVHMDLAARNCFITVDNVVKLGGYGTSVQIYKEEYYCQGNAALPLRWCDPDSITYVTNLIETREITKAANVWSFGVILWEVLEFGKLPYFELTDDEVLQKVILERSCSLKAPSTPCIHSDRIYEIMQMCWRPIGTRCSIHRIAALINHLYDNKDLISNPAAFETRWTSLQPHSSEQNLFAPTDSTIPRVVLKLKNEFTQNSQMTLQFDHSYIPTGNTSPSHDSISNSTGIEFASVSPSMQNLRGSLEDLNPFGLSIDSVSSEHIPSNNIFLCNVEQPKSNQVSSKDILSQSFNAPVSLKGTVSHHEQNNEMNDCKTDSSVITPVILSHQSKGMKELFDKLETRKKAESLSATMEKDDFIITCKKKCEKDELLQTSLPMLVSTEVKSFIDRVECSCDKSSVETNATNEADKCMCSLNSPTNNPSVSIHISQADSSDRSICHESKTKKNKDYIDCAARIDSKSSNLSSKIHVPSIKLEHTIFEDNKSNFLSCDNEKYTTFECLEDKELACTNSTTCKDEIECSDKINYEKSEIVSDTALLDDLSASSDISICHTSTPYTTTCSDSSVSIYDKFRMLSNDESRFLDVVDKSYSTCEESFNAKIGKTATELLESAHSTSPSHDNIVIYNQTTDTCPNKQICTSNISLECEIEPGGINNRNFDLIPTNDISLLPENCINDVKQHKINPSRQNLNYITKIDQEMNEGDVKVCFISESKKITPPLIDTNYIKDEKYASGLITKVTNDNSEKPCDILISQNMSESNEKITDLSFEYHHCSKIDKANSKRPESCDDVKCQSTEPVILVTECSTSPGSQSEGDEYQLEDISSVLKEVEQTNINDNAAFSSTIQHDSVFLDGDGKISVRTYSSDQAGPSEWNSGHNHATYNNYWTERIPLSSNSSKNVEENSCKMKSLSDVVILEDLDTGCEKDIVACYEPYQDPFETDEVLSVDTETNVAVLLDSHHSVIGFVPSKVDMFTGNRELEDEVLSTSEVHSNSSDFIDNNAHIYINGYKSSDSASPRSLCSTSTDFSVNADQRSETSVESDLVPDLSASHSTNECKASFENKRLLHLDLGTSSEQQHANDINLDFKIENNIAKEKDLERSRNFNISCREDCPEKLNSPSLYLSVDVTSPSRDAYTPDFDSDTDDTSSTGTTCTSTSGSFECLYKSSKVIPSESTDVKDDESLNKSPVQIFSVTWDRNATPTKSSMKSPEKKGGQMKKSVSFQEEDPPLFSYPPESEGSDDDSRGFDYPANFLWNVDYSVYADWDFQSSLDLEEIPEDIVEVEDPEEDDEYLSFRYKSLPLRPIQVYTFTDITDDDDYSESASLKTNLSEIGAMEECVDSRRTYLEAKSDDNSSSPSNSVPNEVCQEVIEIYPNFDDLSTVLETSQNENDDDDANHKSDNFTVLDVQDFGRVMNNSKFKERYYSEFAKPDVNLAAEHCVVSEGTMADSENALSSNISLENSHYYKPNNMETQCLINIYNEKQRQESNEPFDDNDVLNTVDEIDLEHMPAFFHETENLDEMCENICSQGNCVNFQQKDYYFKEINDGETEYSSHTENKDNLQDSIAVVGDCLNQGDEKERNHPEEKNKYIYSIDDEFCGKQSNKVQTQSHTVLDLQIPELNNTSGTEQYSDCLSPADVSLNVGNTSFENCDESESINAVNKGELSFDNCELIKNINDVTIFEFEKSAGNLIRPKNLSLYTTDSESSFVQYHESNFDEPQTMFAATYIADDHSRDVLYLSKDREKCSFVAKLDNSNVANDINTSASYYRLNRDKIDIPVASAGLQDSTNNILYEDVAEGKDISEGSLSSKSTEDSSEKDSAISSGGEFSPAYSPGILQESRDTIWDFQHMSCADNSEKSAMMENAKDDNENSSAGPVVDMDTSALLPAIVVSDSDNVNFTIHSASVLQTYNNFRYEHNGNIPTDTRANLATAACDSNDNIV